ncbi:hypothetical protein HK101_005852 [Irineochytrium annulatum]|nr:hypothetical protein HK101_005852 [Irineochytrium annulatum]
MDAPGVLTVTYAIRGEPTGGGRKGLAAGAVNGMDGVAGVLTRGGLLAGDVLDFYADAEEDVEEDEEEDNDAGPGKEGAKLKRTIRNEKAVVERLGEVVASWTAQQQAGSWGFSAAGAGARFRAVDFAMLSFEEQVAVAQGTDVLVAPHGAVFVNALYLRQESKAGVLELVPPQRRTFNEQFRNLAKRMGHAYRRTNIDETVNERQIKDISYHLVGMLSDLSTARAQAIKASSRKGDDEG